MSEKEKTDPETHRNNVQKPEAGFKTIRVFSSFEEMEEDELKWLAG